MDGRDDEGDGASSAGAPRFGGRRDHATGKADAPTLVRTRTRVMGTPTRVGASARVEASTRAGMPV